MNIKGLIKNPIFKRYFYYVTLLIATYTLVSDIILLTSLIKGNSDCKEFENNKPLINTLLQEVTNIARWDSSNVTFDYDQLKTYYFPDLDTPAHVLDRLYIRRGGFFGSFSMSNRFDVKGFKSYAGVVGTANTSFPLVVPVAAADNDTTSYFAIREGNISLTPVCHVEIPNCFMTKQISFPFTFIQTDTDDPNTDESVSVASDNSTFSIYPGLQLHICQYTQNTANSYSWARQFAIAAGILILALELLKVVISLTSAVFLIRFKQPSIVNFANNSPIWIVMLLRDFPGAKVILQTAMNLEETNSLQILSDTFLHSLPMLVLSIQSISYRFNEIKQPPPIITILSCVGSCAMLLFNFFRICVSIKVTVPKQIEGFKAELSQYFDKHPKQKRQQYFLIFALIDCAINLFPPIFMISLAVQGFNSVFVFIVPLLVIFAKILICISMFWSQRFRKPLSSPLIFSFAMNSPIILLCIISSPLRQLITIIAADGFTIWTGWLTDFISIDLPILVTLLMMGAFGHGNNQDVALLQRNLVLVIFATIYLVWRIISGLWYLRNSIITRDTNNKVHTRSTETFPISYILKLNRESPTAWIFTYTLSKLLIWIVGLQIIITMVFMSQPPSPNPEAYVTVSPKILMVLGLDIYLCFDVIVSLALLISYYGPFSTRTIALYLNSPFLIIFYILLGPHFRAEIIAATKDHVHALLLWKQRDIVLICSLLFIWPGFGFGYIPYGSDDRYSWWSWYGWGYDVKTKKVDNSVDPKWSFFGISGAIYGLSYCVTSILRNTVPIDELDKQE